MDEKLAVSISSRFRRNEEEITDEEQEEKQWASVSEGKIPVEIPKEENMDDFDPSCSARTKRGDK